MGTALDTLSVLIVDDDSRISRTIRTILETVGVRHVDVRDDSQSGFAAFCRDLYDVVIIDYGMPRASGIELLDLIRTAPESPNPYAPVIMVSDDFDEERVKTARDHGVNEFLAKPFTPDTIVKRIQSVIDDPRRFIRTSTYFGPDRRRSPASRQLGPDRRRSDPGVVALAK